MFTMAGAAAAPATSFFTTTTRPLSYPRRCHRRRHIFKPLAAQSVPSPPPPYQPFRPPPPSSAPTLTHDAIISTLADRLGLWFDYAPLIPLLANQGFSPTTIEEATGISGVEQNRLVVASKVRESLIPALPAEVLAFFDAGGAEMLYELRLLNNAQRAAAAARLVERNLDARVAAEIARAMKDFPRRRADPGWADFSRDLPGDCLAFAYLRLSREEARNPATSQSWLERAAEEADSDPARTRLAAELRRLLNGADDESSPTITPVVAVPVVRMRLGEVAEASSVAVLPVCESSADVITSPECTSTGDFGMTVASKNWSKFVVLPGWEPILTASAAAVAVAFPDARVLPWKANRWQREEPVLVVVDRAKKAVEGEAEADGFYLIGGDEGRLEVERGVRLKEKGVEDKAVLGAVVVVVRPPKEEDDDQIADEDWE